MEDEDEVISTPPRPRGVSKLDQARAKRRTQTTQAVAAEMKPKPAPAPEHPPVVKNLVLPADVVATGDLELALFRKETGRGLSWSALAEVALRELLDRPDLQAVLESRGARARRPNVVK